MWSQFSMNIKFIIEYKGTNYHGWQIQKNDESIQGHLKKAFKLVLPSAHINIIGSGRTDAGVHSFGQVANVKLSKDTNLDKLFYSINGIINNDIYIKDYQIIDDDFNARFSAKTRSYKYYISKNFSPFSKDISWLINEEINYNLLEKSAAYLNGEHDFSSFSKNNIDIKNKKCFIYESVWEDTGNSLIYSIKANRFLHHMVRFIVGTSIKVAKSNITLDNFIDMLNNKSISDPHCAPAKGLFLNEVLYD
jgi:tRNA pseudouridine38-40 synthase